MRRVLAWGVAAVAAVVFLTLAAAIGISLLGDDGVETVQEEADEKTAVQRGRRALSQRHPGPSEEAGERPASPYLAAHKAIAEELGYVAIRCWVGEQFDGHVVGPYFGQVANGWFTEVETQLEGERIAQRSFEVPDPPPNARASEGHDYESLFIVSWHADSPGTVVPCEVRSIERAQLQVRVVDETATPVPAAKVIACGGGGETDEDGRVILDEVYANRPCPLLGYAHVADRACEGRLSVHELVAHEVREVVLPIRCRSAGEWLAWRAETPETPPLVREPSLYAGFAEEVAVFERLQRQDLGARGDALIEHLLAHRSEVRASRERARLRKVEHDRLNRELDALMEQLGDPEASPEAREAARAGVFEIMDELGALDAER